MKSYQSVTLLIIYILFSQFVNSQTFEKLISTDYDEVAYDAINLNDSTTIILSQKGYYSTHDYPYLYLYKLTNYGQITDSLIIAQDSLYPMRLAQNIFLDSSDNLVIVGRVEKLGAFNADARQYIAIVDQNLNLIHDTITGSELKSDIPFNFILNSKNNIIAVGFTEYDTVHNNYIAEYSISGDLVQRSEYNWDAMSASSVVELIEDSVYHISNIYSCPDMIIVVDLEDLNIVDTIGFSSTFYISDLINIPSSQEYFVTGIKSSFGNWKLFLTRMDYYGQVISENLYGIEDTNCYYSINSLNIRDENELFLVGTHNFPNNPPFLSEERRWIFVNKLNIDGSIIWQRFYKGKHSYMPYKVLAMSDGGALIFSTKYDWNNPVPNQRDIHILRVDSTGWYEGLTTGIAKIDQPKQILVYPNPAKDKVNFVFGLYQNLEINLFNLMGELILSETYKSAATIDISHLPTGTYIYKIAGENGFFEEGKLVKQ